MVESAQPGDDGLDKPSPAKKSTPPDAKPPAGKASVPKGGPVRINLSAWMSLASVAVGLTILVPPMFQMVDFPSAAEYRLSICIGFALVLSGLGTQASGTWRSWSVAGAGAAAAMLYLLLYSTAAEPAPASDPALIARVEGGFDPATSVVQVEANNSERLFTAWKLVGLTLRVRIEPHQIKGGCLGFVLLTRGAVGDDKEAVTYVPSSYFKSLDPAEGAAVAQEETVLFYRSGSNTLFKDSAGAEPISFPFCPATAAVVPIVDTAAAAPNLMRLLVSTAQAQTRKLSTPTLLQGLKSNNALVRREARQMLADDGLESIEPTMRELAASPNDYRVQIGAASTLSQVLYAKTDPAKVRARLTDADIGRLAPLVAHDDYDMRRAATAAMEMLADPRAIDDWAAILKDSPNQNGRYNAAYILNRTWESYDAPTRSFIQKEVAPLVARQGPRTQELLMPVVTTTAAATDGWAYVGISYGKGWDDKRFTWDGDQGRAPGKGDVLTALRDVGLHSDMIRFSPDSGWVEAPEIGALKRGDKVRVTESSVVASGLHWVRVEPVN